MPESYTGWRATMASASDAPLATCWATCGATCAAQAALGSLFSVLIAQPQRIWLDVEGGDHRPNVVSERWKTSQSRQLRTHGSPPGSPQSPCGSENQGNQRNQRVRFRFSAA